MSPRADVDKVIHSLFDMPAEQHRSPARQGGRMSGDLTRAPGVATVPSMQLTKLIKDYIITLLAKRQGVVSSRPSVAQPACELA